MSKTVWNRYFFGLALITSLVLLVWIAGTKVGAQNDHIRGLDSICF